VAAWQAVQVSVLWLTFNIRRRVRVQTGILVRENVSGTLDFPAGLFTVPAACAVIIVFSTCVICKRLTCVQCDKTFPVGDIVVLPQSCFPPSIDVCNGFHRTCPKWRSTSSSDTRQSHDQRRHRRVTIFLCFLSFRTKEAAPFCKNSPEKQQGWEVRCV
jgi:hypothetical protein